LPFGETLLHRKQGNQTNTKGKVATPVRKKAPMYAAIADDHTNR
jgi:hypothetical protein